MSATVMAKGKILFAIEFRSKYLLAICKALQSLGWEVEEFCWRDCIPQSIWGKMQDKYRFGPVIKRMNEALIEKCKSFKPDVVFMHKGIHIWPQTIAKMKRYNCLVTSNYTDNPFGNYDADFAGKYRTGESILLNKIRHYEKAFYFKRLWGNFLKTIPLYDICFILRRNNIKKYESVGAREVHHLRSFYIPEQDHPVELTEAEQERLGSDVVFIGHYEPDHRIECLESLLDAGIHVRLFGTDWDRYLTKKLKRAFGASIKPLYGNEYIQALCASKMALGFMSKLNKDTYTVRCYEIPACGALLLSERTNELKELYEEDKEAVFFSDKDELVQKVIMLLKQPEKRKAIASFGHKRCLSSGYDVVSRMRVWDDVVCKKLNIT
ncbi:MAG: glycosyltransferase [Verrucomicrobiota bacterium]